MKAIAFSILLISTIAQAGPLGQDVRFPGEVGPSDGSLKESGTVFANNDELVGSVVTEKTGQNCFREPGAAAQDRNNRINLDSAPAPDSGLLNQADPKPQPQPQPQPDKQQPQQPPPPPPPPAASAPKFEGLRLSFVTRTVEATAPPSTVTITELASTVTQTVTAACSSGRAREQGPFRNSTAPLLSQAQPLQQSTVTHTVTVAGSCGKSESDGTQPEATAGKFITLVPAPQYGSGETAAASQDAASAISSVAEGLPSPNPDGNGVGVSTIPIAQSALPTTTFALPEASSPVKPAPESSTPAEQQPPPPATQLLPTSSSSSPAETALPASSQAVKPETPLLPSTQSSAPAPTTLITVSRQAESSQGPIDSPTSTIEVAESTAAAGTSLSSPSVSTSSVSEEEEGSKTTSVAATTASLSPSLALGGMGPGAPLDSIVAPATTPGPGVVAPAQPFVNLSGVTLKSVLDLGNLQFRQETNAPPVATPTIVI